MGSGGRVKQYGWELWPHPPHSCTSLSFHCSLECAQECSRVANATTPWSLAVQCTTTMLAVYHHDWYHEENRFTLCAPVFEWSVHSRHPVWNDCCSPALSPCGAVREALKNLTQLLLKVWEGSWTLLPLWVQIPKFNRLLELECMRMCVCVYAFVCIVNMASSVTLHHTICQGKALPWVLHHLYLIWILHKPPSSQPVNAQWFLCAP